jgi:rhodanese-related sulfurtransferase
MTMPENQGGDSDKAGALRGAALIVVFGALLGIGYNAMGLASKPRHGLAWIKQPEKLESLESLQAPAATSASPGAMQSEAGMPAPGPGDAAAATVSATPQTKSEPAPKKSQPAPAPKKDEPASAAAAAGKKSETPPPAAASKSKSTPDKAGANAAPASTPPKPADANAGPASAPAASTPAPAAPAAGAAATSAAANLPVIPDVTGPLKVELATFKKLYDAGAVFVIDARDAEEYTDGHIKGALGLSYNDAMAEPDKVKKLEAEGKPFVVYCSGGDCELSMNLAKLMVENGKRKVLVYEGGFPEWQGAGYAVSKGANP